ncbi:MAG: FAD-dependent oxidoreductase [Solirubrobacteraceae bacterium]
MDDPVDLLVVGAGAIGLSAAWRAAQRGLRVRVLERDRPGAGASTAAAGVLAPTDPGEWVGVRGAFNLAAIRGWGAFAAELEEAAGTQVGHRRDGALRLAFDDADREVLGLVARTLAGAGVEHELVDGAGCRALEPGVRGAVAGLLTPRDEHVDPGRLVDALGRACTRAGVTITAGVTPVAALPGADGGVGGLRLSDGTKQPAALTVVAAGAWSSQAGWLAEALRPPVRPLAGEYVILRGEPVIRRVLRTSVGPAAARDGGRLWVGTTLRDAGYLERPAAGEIAAVLARWTAILPAVAGLGFERAGCGLRPATPDGLPYVGPAAVAGLAYATGHGRMGVIHAPPTGAAIAALAAGEALPALVVPFAPDRPGSPLG